MQAFSSDSFLTLYQGDALTCLSGLKSGSVDAVVTDPPYSSGAFTLSGKHAASRIKYQNTGTVKTYPEMLGDGRDQRSFIRWAALWLAECWRIARPCAPLLVFSDWRQLPAMTDAVQIAGWQWRGIVVWHKSGIRPMRGEFRHEAEFIVYGRKNARDADFSECLPGVYRYPTTAKGKFHVTGKPLPLMCDLLRIARPGGVVLDPFLGGGTTAAAAKQTGRFCIGIELSPEYAAISRDRVLDIAPLGF